MEEQEKPRFKVDEPVYVIEYGNGEYKDIKLKGFITYIHKLHGFQSGLKSDGAGPFVYFMYSVDVIKGTGKSNPQFTEKFIQERYV